MNILAIETASRNCSAAILFADGIHERSEITGNAHAELILPMIESLLSEVHISLAHIDALAFGRGPGSFSGVRVATAVVQGLAFGAQRPVVPVSSLMALAAATYRIHKKNKILACMDARMGQVYWSAYSVTTEDQINPSTPEALSVPEDVWFPDIMSWFRAGSGFESHRERFARHMPPADSGQDSTVLPSARDIAVLARRFLEQGGAVNAEAVLPVYIRNQVAWPKSEL